MHPIQDLYVTYIFVFIFAMAAPNLLCAQDDGIEIEIYSSYSTKDGMEVETKVVRFKKLAKDTSAEIEFFFYLDQEQHAIIGKQSPRLSKNLEDSNAEIMAAQRQQFEALDALYLEKMKQEIMETLRSTGGRLNKLKHLGLSNRLKGLRAEQKLRASGVLLPHQKDAQRQVRFQRQFASNIAATLAQNEISELLGLNKEQLKKIRLIQKRFDESVESLARETNQKIEEELESRNDKIFGKLQPEQSVLLKKLLGEKSQGKEDFR